jgi:hypothetical protein
MTHYDGFRKIVLCKKRIFARLLHTFPQRLIHPKKAQSKTSLRPRALTLTKKLAHFFLLNDPFGSKPRGGAAW